MDIVALKAESFKVESMVNERILFGHNWVLVTESLMAESILIAKFSMTKSLMAGHLMTETSRPNSPSIAESLFGKQE